MFNFFRKKTKYPAILEKKPLNYWEEFSYIIAIPKDEESFVLDNSVFDRVNAIPNLELDVAECTLPNNDDHIPGSLHFDYNGATYEANFYYDDFDVKSYLSFQKHFFTEEEIEKLEKATKGLTLFLKVTGKPQEDYKMQLAILSAMLPDALGFVDESAEKMLNEEWVKLTVESKTLPAPQELYSIQAVAGEEDVWLHTHGLTRFGVTELEVLNSDKENYYNHQHLIIEFANRLIEGSDITEEDKALHLGQFINGEPIVATYLPWTEGLKMYEGLDLGGVDDRIDSHNSETSILFLYASEKDYNNDKVTKVEKFSELFENNPIFYKSKEESERMRDLARERFSILENAAIKLQNENKDYGILLKIGLLIDDAENDDDLEHIWFELLEFNENKFRVKLTQEPYMIADLHEGDEREYTIDNLTDWILYTEFGQITPNTVYLIEKLL